jgi:rhodanese-related sulfurtransferase
MAQVHFYIFAFFSLVGYSQETLPELLNRHNTKGIPYITVQELAMPKTKALILDAREIEEFEVSHIKDALFVGYTTFDLEKTTQQLHNKHQPIVVYCSLGIRSEIIADKLKKARFTNVFNLYGGIFEWKNNNFKVYNSEEKQTDSIHVFSKEWSKWLLKGKKVY